MNTRRYLSHGPSPATQFSKLRYHNKKQINLPGFPTSWGYAPMTVGKFVPVNWEVAVCEYTDLDEQRCWMIEDIEGMPALGQQRVEGNRRALVGGQGQSSNGRGKTAHYAKNISRS
jgi:hypothetical protein